MGAQPKMKVMPAIRHDPDAPPPCQAAQIAFTMMRRAKVSSWRQLLERLEESPTAAGLVWLTDEQQAIIDAYAHLLPYLSKSEATVTVVACTGCGEYGLHDKRAASSRCYFTRGCDGKLSRAALNELSAAALAKRSEVAALNAPPPPTPKVERAHVVEPKPEPVAVAVRAREEPPEQLAPASSEVPPSHTPVVASFLAIDFELGTPSKASPVQLGMVRVIGGEIQQVYRSWIRPPHRVERFGAWQIENLAFGPEVQDNAPQWQEVLAVIEEAARLDGVRLPLVAHNAAATERHVISQTTEAAGLAAATFDYACTMQVAKAIDPGAGRYGLEALAERYGLQLGAHHDAGDDAHATALLAVHLLGMEGGRAAFNESVRRLRS